MRGRAVIVFLFALPVLAVPAHSAGYDDSTLAGMDAYASGEWSAAVRAFAAARDAFPEEPLIGKRLAEAKKRAIEFWRDAAERCAAAEAWTGTRVAVLVLRELDPGCQSSRRAEAALKKAGKEFPGGTKGATLLAALEGGPEARARAALEHGAAFDTASRLADGCLSWLVSAQEEDGIYSCKKHGGSRLYSDGVTGLAVMAMLGRGEGLMSEPRGTSIRKAVDRLVKGQGKDGHFGNAAEFHYPYCHAIATEAIARFAVAAGETKKLKPVLRGALNFIYQRHNEGAGWRYGNRMGQSDTSVTFWMVSALDALGKAGLPIKRGCHEGARSWAEKVTRESDGMAGYTEKGTGSAREEQLLDIYPYTQTRAITSACAMIRYLSGDRSSKAFNDQIGQILGVAPLKAVPDIYYWHIGTRALMAAGDGIPPAWYRNLVEATDFHRAADGSINPADAWGKDGGRVYSTALAAMALLSPVTEANVGGPPGAASRFIREGKWTGTIPPTARPIPTGLYVDEGMKLTADPTGSILYWPGHPDADPGGAKKTPPGRKKVAGSSRYGCLLGQIGREGKPFPIRRKGSLRIRGCGHLYLLVNDRSPSGAKGEFELELTLSK